MPTVEFQFHYADIGNGQITNLAGNDSDPSTVYTITFDGQLESGDLVTLTYPNGATDQLQYFGLNDNGEPGFVLPGNPQGATDAHLILSNTQFDNGDPFPTGYDPTEPFVCFLAGTMIATPTGGTVVESLSIGDLVMTADGRAVPVKWLGRQTIVALFGINESRQPVSIAAGALGEGLPERELRLTATHALLIDGVLVHAGALVNGTSIQRIAPAELGERFVVYHIETENHEVVLAEGMPAETFIDNVTRTHFDNYAEYEALYGPAPAAMEELRQPRAMSHRQVPAAIRARIAAAAAALLPARSEVA
ncbi:Hint domain-containing protein [Mesorhizobium sp. LHD-90]|uniref:Hint domain-containing protein n=1 Tax=Mesorhizobium sp. LHD-90 TaxID=3071414 RepID=UPI0027E0E954|nr:Hint domain-containing protein [Mesorhizobium sp. LHD-90]MDQ6435770.1 Hint domain-containing protein [Mesorhizobium sp. LHD-90]